MKILLDCSPAKIKAYSEKYNYEFGQLRTPLTQYAPAGVPHALDNGCFKRFKKQTWLRMVEQSRNNINNKPLFVTLPDIVGDARRTIELFYEFLGETNQVKRALVLQDGIGDCEIPWRYVDAVFVGGSDEFKLSQECVNACKAAKMLDKWVHVGRVNTAKRVQNWIGLADSIDGSGLSKYDHMLEDVLDMITGNYKQYAMELV